MSDSDGNGDHERPWLLCDERRWLLDAAQVVGNTQPRPETDPAESRPDASNDKHDLDQAAT